MMWIYSVKDFLVRNTAIIIAVCSLVTAVAALFVSIADNSQNRKHYSLSVEPAMFISYYENKEGAGWQVAGSGLGPAKIIWSRILYDGNEIQAWKEFEDITGITGYTYSYLTPNTVFAKDGFNKLFWLPANNPSLSKFRNNIKSKITIEACYCSMYESPCWLASSKKTHIHKELKTCAE